MNINKNIFTVCRLISLFMFIFILISCQPSSPYERRPGLFQKPFKVEESDSFRIRTYRTTGGTSYPFSIIEIDGKEIELKESHIRYPNICYDCPQTGSEAIGFQLYSKDENLRGTWVLFIKNKEKKYFHLNSQNGVEINWTNTNFGNIPTFNAESGNCIPDECKSYPTLVQ